MRIAIALSTSVLMLVALVPVSAGTGVAPAIAFERLKSLAGTWEGSAGEAGGPPSRVEYRITAAGSTVLEIMFPGTEHEMVNAFYLDGNQLVLTHYCAAGNQPRMALDATASTPEHLRFTFTGGSNLDPSKDMHIHSGEILFRDNGGITEDWHAYQNGEQAATNRLVLERSDKGGS